MILIELFAAILLGLVPAFIASGKGKSFSLWWLYGSALFIAALPHALLAKPDSKTQEAIALADGGKKCPYCAEVVKAEAKVCRFCQRDLPSINPDFPPPGKVIFDSATFGSATAGDEQKVIDQYMVFEKNSRYVITHYDDSLATNRQEEFGSLRSALEYARMKPPPK